jgi:cell division protein FtsW
MPFAPRGGAKADDQQRGDRGLAARVVLGRAVVAESADYFLLLGITLFLVAFGLVMVLSSSSVEAMADGKSFLGSIASQGTIAIVAVPLMLVVSRMPSRLWSKGALVFLIGAVVLQLLVFTPLGYEFGGNRNWLRLVGGFGFQPAEVAKLGVILWLGRWLADHRANLGDWRRVLLPALLVVAVPIGLVLIGKDLGTALIMILIVVAMLFFSGVPLSRLGVMIAVVIPVAGILSQASSSRTSRIDSWMSGCNADYLGDCWQVVHGRWALAAGGIFGVGLGNSKAKWSWLPEADNDFIFAVIGEEMGLIGALLVVVLFVLLAVTMLRIQSRAGINPMGRLVVLGIVVWITGQALVNIGVILGVFPVLGVPLPLISAGGSALLVALLAVGVVLSYSRVDKSRDDAATAAMRPAFPAPSRSSGRGGPS